jgi:para-nitrobenzyl esterase
MIFGESAGAVNVCALMTAAPAAGLFHRALMQSGGCFSTPREVAKRDAAALIGQSSCSGAADKLACLRELSAEAALRALPSSLESLTSTQVSGQDRPFGPSHGEGALLVKKPLDALLAGEFARVPFVIGTNRDEMANLLAVRPQTTQQYEQLIRQAFLPLGRDIPDLILDMYPASDYASPHDALIQVYSDARFTCPARTIARAVSARQAEQTWRYFFTRRAVTAQGTVPAQHAIELVYVFGSINSIPLYRPAAEDTALATAMQRYWSEFARGGAPSSASDPMWPTLGGDTDRYLELGTELRVLEGVNAEKCDLWDGLIARFTD